MKLAILISTFERYEKLAHWTASQIKRQWTHHPPVFYSGLQGNSDEYLYDQGGATDWMSVTLHAVKELLQRGFTHAYLVLDDHPPVGPCHEKALNKVLPSLALELDAAYIGLLGYGQHRGIEGKILSLKYSLLEQSNISYRWKFSLHPGLWNLKGLQTILVHRLECYSEEERTPWNFEKHHDDPNDPKMIFLMKSSYRINGALFLKRKWKMTRTMLCENIERFFAERIICKAKMVDHPLAWHLARKKLFWKYVHYLGPYPLCWSGVMHQGKTNESWEQWLQHSGDVDLQSSWQEVKQLVFPLSSNR